MGQLVSFCRGKKRFYLPDYHSDKIYFAPDTREILVNNISYGVSTSWELKILKSIVSLEKDPDAIADFVATTNDGSTYRLSFSNDIKNVISTAVEEVQGDYTKDLEELVTLLLSNIKDSELVFNEEEKTVKISFWDGNMSAGFDVSSFLKDGMLKDVQYVTTPEKYLVRDKDGNPAVDLEGNEIYEDYKLVPFLKFIFDEDWAKNHGKELTYDVIRIPVNLLIDVYEGIGAVDITTGENGTNIVDLTPLFINSLGVREIGTLGEWVLDYQENPTYLKNTTSMVDALTRLDKEIAKINATNVGTVSVTDTWTRENDSEPTRNKYVTVDSVTDENGSTYVVKEDLDMTLMGWEEID